LAFASRGLTKSEKNYPAHRLEFLAMKWAICDKFKDYIFGNTFRVLTDNNPLTYVLPTASLDTTGHRWLAALGAFDFEITYRPGKNNADADSLSRLATPSTISKDSIKTICNTNTIKMSLVENMYVSPDVLESQETGIDMSLQIHNDLDWVSIEQTDLEIGPWITYVKTGMKPEKGILPTSPLYRQFDHLIVKDGLLVREGKPL
jgi:hypothetical protein